MWDALEIEASYDRMIGYRSNWKHFDTCDIAETELARAVAKLGIWARGDE